MRRVDEPFRPQQGVLLAMQYHEFPPLGISVCNYDTPDPDDYYNSDHPSLVLTPSIGTDGSSMALRYVDKLTAVNSNNSDLRVHPVLVEVLHRYANNFSYFCREFGDGHYGRIEWLGHIGAGGGSPRHSFHNHYKALDISWYEWTGGNTSRPIVAGREVETARGEWRRTTHRRLVAVEAGLRKYFGYVLNRYIGSLREDVEDWLKEGPGSPHRNHFHVDNGCGIGLRVDRTDIRNPVVPKQRKIRSCHYFIQDCIWAFTDIDAGYDGIWGEDTERGYLTLLRDMGMERLDPVRYVSHYLFFLDYIIIHGLTDSRSGTYRWLDDT